MCFYTTLPYVPLVEGSVTYTTCTPTIYIPLIPITVRAPGVVVTTATTAATHIRARALFEKP